MADILQLWWQGSGWKYDDDDDRDDDEEEYYYLLMMVIMMIRCWDERKVDWHLRHQSQGSGWKHDDEEEKYFYLLNWLSMTLFIIYHGFNSCLDMSDKVRQQWDNHGVEDSRSKQ